MDASGIDGAIEQSEEGGRDVDGIGDQADVNLRQVEHAPQDVVVAVEKLGAGIPEMREAGGAGLAGVEQRGGVGIGMAQVDTAAKFHRKSSGGERPAAFRGDGQEQGIVACRAAEFVDVFRAWIQHAGRIVGSAVARFGREEGAFDMPAGDGGGEGGVLPAKIAKVCQPADERGPMVGDQRQKEAGAAGLVEGVDGMEEIRFRKLVLLEIDAGEAVDLEIEQRRSEPGQDRVGVGRGFKRSDAGVVPMQMQRLAGGVVSDGEGRHGASVEW